MLLSLIMFGSRARGDHRHQSDVDLLGVVESGRISDEPNSRGVNVFLYPYNYLISKSEGGDLFLLHVCREGVSLHDTAGLFENIKSAFKFKDNYSAEIDEASGLVWLFARNRKLLVFKRNRKRLVWALRTILIARAAEERKVAFSSSDLAAYSRLEGLKPLIDRRQVVPSIDLLSQAVMVAEGFGVSAEKLGLPSRGRAMEERVAELGDVARSTVFGMRLLRRPSSAKPQSKLSTYL